MPLPLSLLNLTNDGGTTNTTVNSTAAIDNQDKPTVWWGVVLMSILLTASAILNYRNK
jgi:hypothetical protein